MKLREFRSVFDLSQPFGKPTTDQLTRINSRLRNHVRDNEIFVFPFEASNRNVDSYYSIMDDSSLRNYAEDYESGLSILSAHNDRVPIPTGRSFEGKFDAANGKVLGWGYITRGINIGNGQSTDDIIRAIETGTLQDGSIRFAEGYDRCEVCKNILYSNRCDHMPGREYEIDDKLVKATYRIFEARAKEYSLVAIGATPEAGVIRKAHLLKERGVLKDKDIRTLSRTFNFNLRTAIEGDEYLKFSFESETDDDGDEGTINHDQDPNTGKQVTNDSAKDKPDSYVSTDSDLDGRMTQEEIDIGYWTNYLTERMASLSAENIEIIQTYIAARERKEKAEPPQLKANTHTHTHSHGDQTHEHEHAHHYGPMDNHAHEHDNNGTKAGYVGDGYLNDRTGNVRFIRPARKDFRIDELIRASVIPVGADKGVPEPGEMDMAGLVMPGQEPLQDVPFKVWEQADGPATPGEDDINSTQGDTSLEVPELHIEPSGIIKFLYNGKEAVSGGVGLGGMIPMSSSMKGDFEGEFREEPIKVRLDIDNLRSLVVMARDGAFYRQRLMHDMLRFGLLKDGNNFNKDLYIRITSKMNTDELSKFVGDMMRTVEDKFKPGEIIDIIPSEFFPSVERRQTLGPGALESRPAASVNNNKATKILDPLDRNDLYSDRR